jgi:hypothetical protein
MAVKAWLEAQMVTQIFKLEARILREEIRVETTWPVPAEDEVDEMENGVDEEMEYGVNENEDEDEDDEMGEEEMRVWSKGARKRTRDEYEEAEEEEELSDSYSDEGSEYGGENEDDDDTEEEDEEEVEEVMPPSPPTKRAKFAHPCVVPSCDKGYANKASLQRHVFKDHDRVSDPVAKRACRLLWGETFKGGRMPEVNRRYGEYPKGV